MAKRMTDTEKWKKEWFRKLKPLHKCFWEFIRDNCNHAGIWEVDIEAAEFYINSKLNKEDLMQIFQNHILPINGTKWFVIDFIEFQYKVTINELNPDNKIHKSIICLLEKYSIIETLSKGLGNPYEGVKDKDKDKVKDKVKEKLHLFKNSPYYDIELFKQKISEDEKYKAFNLDYYYEVVKVWSEEGKMKMNWIATAKNWMLRDFKDNKAKMNKLNESTKQIIKRGFDPSSNDSWAT